MLKYFIFSFFIAITSLSLHAQNFSNKGKDFWLGYGYHINMNPTSNNAQELVLYFTSDKSANVLVEIPAVGYSQTYQVIANQVTESDPIPKTGAQDARLADTGKYNRGIHVTSDVDIVAYAHIYNSNISGATLLLPTNTLGKEYYSINYNQSSNANNSNSFCFVVATEDNTTVEITPSQGNKNRKKVGTPFLVSLNKGEIYNLMGTVSAKSGTDLTSTHIRSISTSGSNVCKKIAVFSGSGKISIGGDQSGSSDNLFAQALPVSTWGLRYLTSPTGSQPNNYYRICVADSSTIVKLNGTVIPNSYLNRNFFYELKNSVPISTPGNGIGIFTAALPNYIEADKPIAVAQYCTTQGEDGNPSPVGDPEMIYLSPVEQTINKITLNSTPHFNITEHWINVIIPKGGVPSFKLDGVSQAGSFTTHPQNTKYAYATLFVDPGGHNLYSDTGFNAIAYGFGSFESYGYNAGTNVKDIYQPVFQNPYARLDFATTCSNTPFLFSVPLSSQPNVITWDFGNNPSLSPNTTIGPINSPVYDSTEYINGKYLYYYSPGKTFIFNKDGLDTIKLTATNGAPDGCGSNEAVYIIPITVNKKPTANFSVNTQCASANIQFNDATANLGASTVATSTWIFGDGSPTSGIPAPQHIYSLPGVYNVNYTAITNYGCYDDTLMPLSIFGSPIANFKIASTTCIGDSILLFDSSYMVGGTISKWYWDYGNGKKDTLTSSIPTKQVYLRADSITIQLIVENKFGCKSNPFIQKIKIHPNPIADFQLPSAICLPSGKSSFFDKSTIADSTEASFIYRWNFGDGFKDSIKNPIHYYTTTSPFTVFLSVKSKYGCFADTSKILNTVYPQQKVTFSVSKEVCLRDTTFCKDETVVAGASISNWYWNFNDGSPIDTLQNPNHVYRNSGTDSVTFFVVSSNGCPSDTVTQKTIVNSLPTASFITTNASLCEKKQIGILSTSIPNIGNIVKWNWNLGDSTIIKSTNGDTIFHTYSIWKNYNATLNVTTDKGCKSDTFFKTINIHSSPIIKFTSPDICLSDRLAKFNDSSFSPDNSPLNYHWNFNALSAIPTVPTNLYPTPVFSSQKNPTITYLFPSTYSVVDSIVTNKGCGASKKQLFTVNGANPIASFTTFPQNSFCSNDSIRIQNTSTVDFGNIIKVEIYWDNANAPTIKEIDNQPYSNKIYTHHYPSFLNSASAAKNYTIRFVVYSGTQCFKEISKTITLHPVPKVKFNAIPSICNDTTPRLLSQASEITGIAGNGIFAGLGITTSNGLFNPRLVLPGKDTLKYTFTDAINGCADSTFQVINIWPSPIAKWAIISTPCERKQLIFSDSSTSAVGKIVSWQWTFGDGTTITKNNKLPFSKVYANASQQPFNASLLVITDSGCRSTYNTQPIKVGYTPNVSFTMPISVCLPDGNGTFTSTSTINDGSNPILLSHLWNFGDPNNNTPSTSAPNATHQFTALPPTLGYPIQLIVTKNACSDTLVKNFLAVYPQPKADFLAKPTFVCMGDTIRFFDKTNGISSPVQRWVWDLAQGISDTTQNPKRAFKDSGNFAIKLFNYNKQGCVSTLKIDTIKVYPYPHVDLGEPIYLIEGNSIPLSPILLYGNQLSYQWSPSTYLNQTNIPIPIATPKGDSITYTLRLTGIGNCTIRDSIKIVLIHDLNIPNAFSPNGDGINDTWQMTNADNYPNAQIEIYDRSGQIVYKSIGYNNANGWDGKYNGKPLPVATYYYLIRPNNGKPIRSGSITLIR